MGQRGDERAWHGGRPRRAGEAGVITARRPTRMPGARRPKQAARRFSVAGGGYVPSGDTGQCPVTLLGCHSGW